MYALLLVIHVIVCLVLIFVVLLQAGRGGGFSDMLGGGQPQSLFGTQTNAFMVRVTEVCAVVFIITSLSLALMSSHRGRSIVAGRHIPASSAPAALPETPAAPAASAPAAEPVPAAAPAAADVPSAPAAAPATPAPADAQ